MEEDYVSLNTAKFLGRVGFNEPTDKLYSISQETNEVEIIDNCDTDFFDEETKKCIELWCPTQAFLAKWILKNKNIYIEIRLTFGLKNEKTISTKNICDKKDFYMPVLYDLNNLKMIPFNLIAEELKESPKEALELGLQEALRIIYNDIQTKYKIN